MEKGNVVMKYEYLKTFIQKECDSIVATTDKDILAIYHGGSRSINIGRYNSDYDVGIIVPSYDDLEYKFTKAYEDTSVDYLYGSVFIQLV